MAVRLQLDFKGYKMAVEQILSKARQVAKGADRLAEKTVKEISHNVQEEAIRRVPIDEGFLEKSIDVKIEKSGWDTTGHVFVPSNAPASGYALYMHELFYNLGERSQKKQDDDPSVIVGRRYLARALEENERAYALYIIKQFKDFMDDGV